MDVEKIKQQDLIIKYVQVKLLIEIFKGVFSSQKNFYYSSHRIFEHIHEALNAVEKITNYTV